eukprot:scaffold211810_cov21-Tisochrysis_lutea.AAC.2
MRTGSSCAWCTSWATATGMTSRYVCCLRASGASKGKAYTKDEDQSILPQGRGAALELREYCARAKHSAQTRLQQLGRAQGWAPVSCNLSENRRCLFTRAQGESLEGLRCARAGASALTGSLRAERHRSWHAGAAWHTGAGKQEGGGQEQDGLNFPVQD